MSWFQRCKAAVTKFGVGPAKFLLKTVLPAAVPGSGVVAEVADRLLSLVDAGTPEERFPDIATESERNTVGKILAEFEGRLADLAEQLLEREDDSPEKLARLVVQEIKKDREIEAALRDIAGMVARFDRLEAQNRELLRAAHQGIDLQEVGLAIARRQETLVLDFIADQRAANVQLRELADNFAKLNAAIADLTAKPAEALPKLRQLEAEQPKSAAVREAVAVGATFAFDLDLAASSLERAVALRPDDKPLAELCRQVTIKTRGLGGDSSQKPTPAPTATGPEFRPGDTLDGWKLLTLLGRGGFGQVFKAERNGQIRALKVLLSHLITDPHFEANFKREILTLCNLGRHPHVVHFDEFGFDKPSGSWYFTMEYIEGESLQTRLLRGPMPPAEAVKLFTLLAGPGGLTTVHEKGIVHRDIKPANILLLADGTPKLVDFGVAVATQREEKTKTGGHTVMFASPEQLRGFPAEKPSDVYSLVGSLWYAITKQEPGLFDADDLPTELAPFRAVLSASLHNNPAKRPATLAAQLSDASASFSRGQTVVQAKPSSPPTPRPAIVPATRPQLRLITTLAGHPKSVKRVGFSHDGSFLASADGNAVLQWDASTGKLVRRLEGSDCCFSPVEGLLAVSAGVSGGAVDFWDTALQSHRFTGGRGSSYGCECGGFSRDGKLFLAGVSFYGNIDLIDIATKTHRESHYGLGGSSDVRVNPNGQSYATPGRPARIWDINGGKRLERGMYSAKHLAELHVHDRSSTQLEFSADGNLIATTVDNTVVLWNAVTGSAIRRIAADDIYGSGGIALTPDGALVAASGYDKAIRVWETRTGKLLVTQSAHTNYIRSLCFDPTGQYLASGADDNQVKIWELLRAPRES